MLKILSLHLLLVAFWSHQTKGFAPTTHQLSRTASFSGTCPAGDRLQAFVLEASAGKKKTTKRRVRKQAPGATAEDPVKLAQEVVEGVSPKYDTISNADADGESPGAAEPLTEKDRMLIEDVAKFEFSPPKANVGGKFQSHERHAVVSQRRVMLAFSQ
jgi:hypothetical protein